jgi:RNA polymerase sigma-70 factor, ECF subfamily
VADSESLDVASVGAAGAKLDFASVFRAHYPYVVRLAASLTGDAESAKDVAQDVFVAVFRGLRGFRGESSVKTWIYQITLRTAGRHSVKRRKQPATGLDLDFDELHGGESADSAAALAELVAALASLPLEARTVLALVAIEGLSHEAAAEVLGVPVGTVWSRLHAARRRLLAAMGTAAPRER